MASDPYPEVSWPAVAAQQQVSTSRVAPRSCKHTHTRAQSRRAVGILMRSPRPVSKARGAKAWHYMKCVKTAATAHHMREFLKRWKAWRRAHITSGSYVSTSYGPPWGGINGGGITATGVDLRGSPTRYLIAVDPRVIALHSWVYVWPNPFGWRGLFQARDTGGAIKGNRIDFYDWRGRGTQYGWGRRSVRVTAVR